MAKKSTEIMGFTNGHTHVEVQTLERELKEPPKSTGQEKYDDLHLIFSEVFSENNIELKSVLGKRLLKQMIRGVVYNERYPTKTMALLLKSVLQYKVSQGGRGRTDLVEVLKALGNYGKEDKKEEKNFIQRTLGL